MANLTRKAGESNKEFKARVRAERIKQEKSQEHDSAEGSIDVPVENSSADPKPEIEEGSEETQEGTEESQETQEETQEGNDETQEEEEDVRTNWEKVEEGMKTPSIKSAMEAYAKSFVTDSRERSNKFRSSMLRTIKSAFNSDTMVQADVDYIGYRFLGDKPFDEIELLKQIDTQENINIITWLHASFEGARITVPCPLGNKNSSKVRKLK